ncbi:MAG: hypothetical protein V1824_02740 [archaeon]
MTDYEVLVIPHKFGTLSLVHPVFGPNNYRTNTTNIQKLDSIRSSKVLIGEEVYFRPATIDESISAIEYNFGEIAKPEILDRKWLQAGSIVKTSEGIITNITETDREKLKKMLGKSKKINQIYFLEGQCAFVPYEHIKQGIQESREFAEGGLARALEHTSGEMALKLKELSSPKFCLEGVEVCGFDPVEKPVLKIVGLACSMGKLVINGNEEIQDNGGYVFGVIQNKH